MSKTIIAKPITTPGAAIFITNVTSSGNTNLTMNSAPNEDSVLSLSTDDFAMRVYVEWDRTHAAYEGAPTVNGFTVIWTSRIGDTNYGYSDITGATAIIIASFEGVSYSIAVSADAGPVIGSAVFSGSYPGSQTEVKENDTFTVSITCDINTDRVEFENSSALKNTQVAVTSSTGFDAVATIDYTGLIPQNLGGRVRARTPSGSWGDWFSITNTVTCNDLAPSIESMNQGSISYPVTQEAIKDVETVSVHSTCSNYDTITYSSPNGQLTIPNTSTYLEDKLNIQRNTGDYNITTTNYRISANRAANDSTTTQNLVVYIAHIDCTITMSEAPYLRSGGSDGSAIQDHTITLTSNQNLISVPTISNTPAGAGTWSGVFSNGPTVWTRTLQVQDTDTKGTYAYQSLIATNLANKVQTVYTGDSNYILRGFVTRAITLAAFANTILVNSEAITYANLVMTWSKKALPNKRAVGTTTVPDANSWSIDALSTNPFTLIILDTAAAGANSTPSTITIEETV